MSNVFTGIIDAFKAGFGIASDFGKMIQDTFTSVFVQTDQTGAVTGLSNFGAVALALVGISIVTGIGMLVFRRFFDRT